MNEINPNEPQIGLYRDPESGNFIGCLDENQAAAAIHTGFRLVQAGREAAMTPEAELATLKSAAPVAAASPKKGQ